MTETNIPVQVTRHQVHSTVGNVLCNSSNYPEPHRILGRDLSKLIDATTDAILDLLDHNKVSTN